MAIQYQKIQEIILIDYEIKSLDISETTCLYDIGIAYSQNIALLEKIENFQTHRVGIAQKADFSQFLKTKDLSFLPVYDYAFLDYQKDSVEDRALVEKEFWAKSYYERYLNNAANKALCIDNFIKPDNTLDTDKLNCIRIGSSIPRENTYDFKFNYISAPISFGPHANAFPEQQYDIDALFLIFSQNPQVGNLKIITELNEIDHEKERYLVFDYTANQEQLVLMNKILSHFEDKKDIAAGLLFIQAYPRIIKSLEWIAPIPEGIIKHNDFSNPFEEELYNKIKGLAQVFEEQSKLSKEIETFPEKSKNLVKI